MTSRPPTESTPTRDARSFDAAWVQAGLVLAAWLLALVLEHVFVAIAFRGEFAGSWETRSARRAVIPIAFAALLPAALIAALVARMADRARVWLALFVAIAGGVTAWGVSYGRHMANLLVRVPFVMALAALAAGLAWWLAPLLTRAARSTPRLVAVFGCAVGVVAWAADDLVLRRLYPAFHSALLGLSLAAWALLALVLRPEPRDRTRAPAIVAAVALACGVLAIAYAPRAARDLSTSDNLRLVLVEHAPLEGRAVWLASKLAPPPADDGPDPSLTPPGELPRALDWTGRDVVLLTIDALRADHVSAYGYARPTTPSLDALARDGARFDAAYCPTPHTSYSIASLMTGKYMRPLIALGLGDDSDTWAGLLRRYGYRTAAFYPPAVFFIDGDRFRSMRDRGLDFEYRKEEFASPELRAKQVGEYVASAPHDKPLFLWVHFFEPHEPYVAHAEHPFGPSDLDRYDAEIAAADDGIGAIVREVRVSRPGAVVIATADHGEEFGEHGGRYHGTTVYEEQVRVPLVIDGPGVARGVVGSVVQTIDLLPTVLSALGIPRPARVRGRDLGPLLARGAALTDPGLAFAETDEYTLLARGSSRLVCERRVAACALFDRARDPAETRDVSAGHAPEARDLRRALMTIASEHGRLEHGEQAAWPEALRRGIAGDADAAPDVAALLDDASPVVRVKAAEVSFNLHASVVAPAMRRALSGESDASTTDEDTRRWCALALVRMGDPPGPLAKSLARDGDATWRRRAGLAFAEQGDARGAEDLAAWWSERGDVEYVRATEIVSALAKIQDRVAVPALARSLADVRLRPPLADALAAIHDPSAREPLAATLASEAQVTSRAHEARALAALGGASWSGGPAPHVKATLDVPRGAKRLRLVVLAAGDAPCDASADGAPLGPTSDAIAAPAFDFDAPRSGGTVSVVVDDTAGVAALFLLSAPPAIDAGSP